MSEKTGPWPCGRIPRKTSTGPGLPRPTSSSLTAKLWWTRPVAAGCWRRVRSPPPPAFPSRRSFAVDSAPRGGLPPNMVVEYGDGTWYPANGAVRPDRELSTTALACASAAIALGAAVLAAMAWATPCVTDEATAIQIGALPERDLLIGATADHRYQLGLELATNAVVAAKLSWAGRTLVEQRHSPQLAGARLVRRLGLSGATSLPNEQLLGAQLAELGTPADAVITERVAAATAGFTLGEG